MAFITKNGIGGLSFLACGMNQLLKKRWVYHSLVWGSFYAFLNLVIIIGSDDTDSLASVLLEPLLIFVPIIMVTYLGVFAKEKLFDSRKYFLYFIAFLLVTVIGVLIYEGLGYFFKGMGNSISQSITNFIFIQLFAIGVQYFKRGIVNQYQLQELQAKTVITELNALKAQVNPHFLFNTLNNIYGMNQIDPEKGSEMILELSDVMRYHLEFSKEGKVKLEDEIQLLESYVKLERLRLRETCDVKVDFEKADENQMISPLLFIPFVENAFKHGTHPTKECFVHIDLRTTPENISFSVKNSIIANRKVVKTNIGIQNTKRRLELLFPQKHKLNIISNDAYHLVELNIEI